jgi:hypothetical protein
MPKKKDWKMVKQRQNILDDLEVFENKIKKLESIIGPKLLEQWDAEDDSDPECIELSEPFDVRLRRIEETIGITPSKVAEMEQGDEDEDDDDDEEGDTWWIIVNPNPPNCKGMDHYWASKELKGDFWECRIDEAQKFPNKSSAQAVAKKIKPHFKGSKVMVRPY